MQLLTRLMYKGGQHSIMAFSSQPISVITVFALTTLTRIFDPVGFSSKSTQIEMLMVYVLGYGVLVQIVLDNFVSIKVTRYCWSNKGISSRYVVFFCA